METKKERSEHPSKIFVQQGRGLSSLFRWWWWCGCGCGSGDGDAVTNCASAELGRRARPQKILAGFSSRPEVEERIFSPIRHHLHRPPPRTRPLAATREPGRPGHHRPAAAAVFFILLYFILASSGASGRRRPSWAPRGPGWIGTGRRARDLPPLPPSFPSPLAPVTTLAG